MRSAYEKMQKPATGMVEEPRSTKPKQKIPGCWACRSLYALAATFERNYSEAAADFKKELAIHPDLPDVILSLAGVQAKSGDTTEAQHTIQSYVDKHRGTLKLSLYLAQLQKQCARLQGQAENA